MRHETKENSVKIRNCTITGSEKVVELEGFLKQRFEDRQNYVKNVLMENVVIDDEAGEIHLKACDKITFRNVCGKNGSKPYCYIDQNTVSNINRIITIDVNIQNENVRLLS